VAIVGQELLERIAPLLRITPLGESG